MTSRISGKITIEKTLAFAFGCVFVITLLVLAVKFPEPTVTQWFVFKIVLALVAGAIGAVLPGALEVRVGNWVRGAGALGLVVLVAFLPVEQVVAKIPTPPSIEDAKAVVEPLLRELVITKVPFIISSFCTIGVTAYEDKHTGAQRRVGGDGGVDWTSD